MKGEDHRGAGQRDRHRLHRLHGKPIEEDGRLDSAAKALNEAVRLAQGTGDRLLWAWLFDLNATLLGCSRKLPLAVEMLETCRQLYEELGEQHLAGRVLVTQAVFVFAGGDAARALRLNWEGRLLLDPAREPDLLAQAAQNHWVFEVALSKERRTR